MAKLTLSSPSGDSTVIVETHGAQVLSWRCRGREHLYLSPLADSGPGKAIRGGVPVIFPQFGAFGPGLRHGFARLREWKVLAHDPTHPGSTSLALSEDAGTLEAWPHRFQATVRVDLPDDSSLSIGLSVRNSGDTDLAFTAGLHTYLHVDDLAEVRLRGLRGVEFLDATCQLARRSHAGESLRFDDETDRVYVQAPSEVTLQDGALSRVIRQSGFCDTVVWNPGARLATTLADLPADGHRHFVCIEAACVDREIRLAPGASWHGSQSLIG